MMLHLPASRTNDTRSVSDLKAKLRLRLSVLIVGNQFRQSTQELRVMNKPVVLFQQPAPAKDKPEPAKAAGKPRRRAYLSLARASVIVAGTGLAIVIPLGWGSWVAGMTNQTTDNAYLRADTTPVSAEVSGRILRLLVEDYQHVKIGQLLMQIDPTQYQAQEVDQAKAA
ncbi:biotin/lipoyl-binding protein [Brucella tritici]|uniref:Biotin/lipoyl-binding protein n=2 Tax=Brucella tritici TaxID=94626 RepID=A0A833FK56_9HYPH|nr:biotin/lipoyl-binding protein [Brucella tritici]